MSQDHVLQTEVGAGAVRDHFELMLRHDLMSFVFDAGNLPPVFLCAHDAPKIDHRPRRVAPVMGRREQWSICDQDFRIQIAICFHEAVGLCCCSFAVNSGDTESEYESM